MDPQEPETGALRQGNELPHNYTCPQAFRTPVPEEFYPTRYVADRAIDYICSQKEEDAPFFAYVSFPDPHHPFNPPGRYWDMYHPDQFDPALPYDSLRIPYPPMRWLDEQWQSGVGASEDHGPPRE